MARISWLRGRSRLAVALFSLLVVILIGNAHAGYYPTAWGWCVLAFAWIAGLGLFLPGRAALDRLEKAFLGALSLFIAWNALSLAWTTDVDRSVQEVQRALVYLFGVLAALLVVRRGALAALLAGLVAGATWLSVQALADKLFPDQTSGTLVILQDRLPGSLGYANGFGLLVVMGALLALGFAVYARSPAARAAAGAALPVLVTTAYFTFSRGAMVAAAAGLLVAVAYDRRRLEFVTMGAVVALPSVVGVWIASRGTALTSTRVSVAELADEGRGLALVLLGLILVSALVAVAAAFARQRVRVPQGARRAYGAALAGLALVVVVGAVMSQGGPGPLVDKAADRINQNELPAGATDPNDLNARLGGIGSVERVSYWRVAWDQYQAHPVIGSGAGTFEQFWLRDRSVPEPVIDAHSLYLETLAQLGWPGLVLLLLALALPLVAALRARGEPLAGVALAAYVAYLAHAAVDWDWELPALTLFALLCAVGLMVARDDRGLTRPAPAPWRGRAVTVAATVALVVFSVVGLVGNRALAKADAALLRGDAAGAADAARTAEQWAPWSAQAPRLRGRALFGLGRRDEGRRKLREAARRSPHDWRIWYDLGIASTGSQRERAFVTAATLNPIENDIEALRGQGLRLPPRRPGP